MAWIAGQTRASQFGRRAAKRDDDRRAECGGDVHGPGVVREQHTAEFEQGHQFTKGSLTGEIYVWRVTCCVLPETSRNTRRKLDIARSAKNHPEAIRVLLDFAGCRDKTLNRPALGGAVFGTGIQGKQRASGSAQRFEAEFFPYPSDLVFCDHQSRRKRLRICAECGDEMKILVEVMGRKKLRVET